MARGQAAESLVQLYSTAETQGASPANTSAAKELRRSVRLRQREEELLRQLGLQGGQQGEPCEPEELIEISQLVTLSEAAASLDDEGGWERDIPSQAGSRAVARPVQPQLVQEQPGAAGLGDEALPKDASGSSPAWQVRRHAAHQQHPPLLPASLPQADSWPVRHASGMLLDEDVGWLSPDREAASMQPSSWLQEHLSQEAAQKACSCGGLSCFERALQQGAAAFQGLLGEAAMLNSSHWFKQQQQQQQQVMKE